MNKNNFLQCLGHLIEVGYVKLQGKANSDAPKFEGIVAITLSGIIQYEINKLLNYLINRLL